MTSYFVYILAKARNSTLYVGMTENLIKRTLEHKKELADGFTKKYGIKTLVYFEPAETYEAALFREKQLKKWRRESKLKLIETNNPQWQDLYDSICQ
ncbi:MAG: GIY-YIG nuclease family protein [Alphaproteobacteria bacterium]|nr:GIY-YIG nuclease family protein [Alphaproteobacteria bacterium]